MWVFVDESGDAGLKLSQGSSSHFTIVLVCFTHEAALHATEQRVTQIRQEIHFSPHAEFHFNKLRNDFRERFFLGIRELDFYYDAMVINKRGLWGERFSRQESFYKYVCGLLFQNGMKHLKNATVVIDGSGTREFKKELSASLRKKVNDPGAGHPAIRKVKVQNSESNNLLQVADMIAGAVARSYSEKEEGSRFRRLIQKRERYVQFWPK